MQTHIYRVEVNNGSRHFDRAMMAYAYFQKMKAKRKYSVELWLVTIEKPFEVTQTLIAYAPLK